MLSLVITKYLIALTIIAILSVTETDALALAFNPVTFSQNMRVGGNRVFANGNAGQLVVGQRSNRTEQPAQVPQAPQAFPSSDLLGTFLLASLLGSAYGRGSPYSSPYGYYYPYFGYSPYSYGYPPYYYYYYG
ncbi:hypothetical protein LOAG_17896 [Loa loa]|uniref:Uncharacterized protein n=1 Tax=Loa loa TaxID=7209 RepID=A0A1S0UH21_LOALO|nr:hypothetical protein LOAG_17896 [Loa loa]EJD74843.1 hypothetical protein LOAG_17896 [Loa loa]